MGAGQSQLVSQLHPGSLTLSKVGLAQATDGGIEVWATEALPSRVHQQGEVFLILLACHAPRLILLDTGETDAQLRAESAHGLYS